MAMKPINDKVYRPIKNGPKRPIKGTPIKPIKGPSRGVVTIMPIKPGMKPKPALKLKQRQPRKMGM